LRASTWFEKASGRRKQVRVAYYFGLLIIRFVYDSELLATPLTGVISRTQHENGHAGFAIWPPVRLLSAAPRADDAPRMFLSAPFAPALGLQPFVQAVGNPHSRASPDEEWLEPLVFEHRGVTALVCRYCAGMYGLRGATRNDVFLDKESFLRHLLERHNRLPDHLTARED
jgi:hypothetical protein